mmetsp:Transcript_19947/g.50824  ORF Transcript_19947/g.50824 Transcript_19947/m.50824 type:complete len:255 (+) Transcript_19947:124-888(+)
MPDAGSVLAGGMLGCEAKAALGSSSLPSSSESSHWRWPMATEGPVRRLAPPAVFGRAASARLPGASSRNCRCAVAAVAGRGGREDSDELALAPRARLRGVADEEAEVGLDGGMERLEGGLEGGSEGELCGGSEKSDELAFALGSAAGPLGRGVSEEDAAGRLEGGLERGSERGLEGFAVAAFPLPPRGVSSEEAEAEALLFKRAEALRRLELLASLSEQMGSRWLIGAGVSTIRLAIQTSDPIDRAALSSSESE